MPNIEWNRRWAGNLEKFKSGALSGDFYGDQWGDPYENIKLKKVVDNYIIPYIDESTSVLEIGSGGGRWTQFFLGCKEINCVDLNIEMLAYIKNRFKDCKKNKINTN